MAVRFIFFDLGNVLLDFTHERGFSQIADIAGTTAEHVRAALVDTGLSDRYEIGELTTGEFHYEFCSATNTTASLEELTRAWGDIFEIKPQMVALVANLKSAGHRVGILSNTCAAHWESAARRFRILSSNFDPVITSYEVKSMKPAAGIYKVAASRVALRPEEIFFVDDRVENVEGAKRLGWNARQFTGVLQLAEDLEALGLKFNR